ncbi:serine/threonine-protein kinase [Geothrix sp. PMB-07]|uniref:serine/threonine-protein kinase n=1 Tax=Geothrix sp. PMB-07 TaxID=3068640 RepID=UPI0027426E66|nr:serine/threonine-protein kinase [Geothrix sp. PMB-07]WLT33056.1 serine/threonine-protein kinase [Geothrix sp. PMB-07]
MEGRRIGKYLVQASLGEGGMGRVYQALDATLGRVVALKLVQHGSHDAMVRLLLEAQALARVEHPHICRIYEVGEHEGLPFIAMQRVEGETLQEASARLGQREKIGLIRTVAEAIHAAHRLGLVHRDLKPANIMVTRDADGALQPVVLDFGLVRDVEGPDLTLTGMPMGTPAYMSPEQAEGESARVDRRSDVFSLGATLYELLLGRPPFEGQNPMDTLRRLSDGEAVAPRSLDPALPRDLDTILLTCLERNPARRYDTAKALAEDLGRFLEGEPIAAKRGTWLAKWVRRARRHPLLTASLGAVLLLLLTLAGLIARNRMALERTSRVAAQMGAVSREVETRMRLAYLLPAHSLAPDKAQVRARMAEVQALTAQLPEASTGPAYHALGRGHMALGEWGAARQNLERAWALGHRTAESALSLGLVQAELYQRRLRVVAQLKDPATRTLEREKLHRELRDPAFAHLQAGKGASPAPAHIEALILWLQGNAEGALRQAELALRQSPAAYEASLLAGAIHQQRYVEAIEAKDWPASEAEEAAIQASYEAAAAVGRCDPRALEGLACRLIFSHNDRGVYRDQEVDHLLEDTAAITRRLLELDAESARGHCCQAYVLWRRAQGPTDNRQAIEEARLATRFDPDDDYGWVLLAATLSRAVDHQWQAGQDPEAAIQESVAASEALLRLVPRGSHHGLIALEKLTKAKLRRYQYRLEAGRPDPRDEAEAQRATEEALHLEPQYQFFEQMAAWFHLHRAWQAMGEGRDPEADLEAILALSRRTEAASTFAARRLDLRVWALLARAEHRLRRREDPREPLSDLERSLQEGERLGGGAKLQVYAAKVALLQAQWDHAQGHSPVASLDRAAALARGLARAASGKGVAAWRAQAPLLQAEVALRRVECQLGHAQTAAAPLWPSQGWLSQTARPVAPSRSLQQALATAASVWTPGPDLDFERPGTRASLLASLHLLQATLARDAARWDQATQELDRLARRDTLLATFLRPARPPASGAKGDPLS